MGAHDAWGAASSIQFELPVSGQDYYAWVTEMATSMNVPFRHHYSTQKAEDGTGFWLIEEMHRCGQGRGALFWVGVAPGSTDELTEFTLSSCNDAVSVATLKATAQKSIDELCQGEDVEAEAVNAAQATAVRPSEPAKPPPGAGLDAWFDWYHAMKGAGYHCTLGDVARETGYSEGHIKHEHRSYKLRRGRLPQKTH